MGLKSQIPEVQGRSPSRGQLQAASLRQLWLFTAEMPHLLHTMLTTPQPVEEDHARLKKPLARPREIISADSAKGSAATPNPPDPDDVTAQSQRGTPERPPRNRSRRAVVDDGPDAEDVAAQAALIGRADSKSTPPQGEVEGDAIDPAR